MKTDDSFILLEDFREEINLSPNVLSKAEEAFYLHDKQGNTLKVNKKQFIHNGKGIGLVSNRLIQENETWLISEIEQLFLEKWGIVFLYFIPVFPNDKSGNIEKYLEFKDERTLIWKNSQNPQVFWGKIHNFLRRQGLRIENLTHY